MQIAKPPFTQVFLCHLLLAYTISLFCCRELRIRIHVRWLSLVGPKLLELLLSVHIVCVLGDLLTTPI